MSPVDVWTCKTNVEWATLAGGCTVSWRRLHGAHQPSVMPSQYGWACECEGYRHTATCKHIDVVSIVDPRCRWNADMIPVRAGYHNACNKNGRCPFCHGEAVTVPREVFF